MDITRYPRRFRVALLPLALVAILATTAIPLELRPATGWAGGFNFADIAENLLLYAPLGIALWRRGPGFALLTGLLLSGAIEWLQMWQIGRFASPIDVAANALGSLIGAVVRQRLAASGGMRADRLLLGRRWTFAACAVLVLFGANWMFPLRSSALLGWQPDYALLLGNEFTGHHPWSGTIRDLVLLPRSLTAAEFDDVNRNGVMPREGAVFALPQPLTLAGREPVRLLEPIARSLADQAVRANALTVITRLEADNIEQLGPAKIVSFSGGPYQRNFDLGQDGRRLAFQLRSPVSGDNAIWNFAHTGPVLESGRETTIVASFDGRVARIHVDGALAGRSDFAAAACPAPALCNAALPAAWTLIGAAAAVIVLTTIGAGRGVPPVAASLVAGGCVVAAAWILPTQSAAWSAPWTRWLALVGALTIGLAARPAERDREVD